MFQKSKSAAFRAARWTRSNVGKIGTGAVMLAAAPLSFAASTPGAAIASELSGGEADMGLVFAACAVLIGVLLVWAYVRRSAK